ESVAAIERLQSARSREEIDSCVNALTKLMRMSVLQYEAYQRLCPSNETNITVQNVSVSDGGQAIVGNITHNGQSGNPATKLPLAISHAHSGAMPILSPDEQHATPAPIIEPKECHASAPIRRRRGGGQTLKNVTLSLCWRAPVVGLPKNRGGSARVPPLKGKRRAECPVGRPGPRRPP